MVYNTIFTTLNYASIAYNILGVLSITESTKQSGFVACLQTGQA